MFQLYKQRDFNEMLNDTVGFFKSGWKNYFTNFIVITGAMLLVLCLIFFFIFRDLFASLISGKNNYDFSTYFQDNMVSLIILFAIAVIVTVFFSIACMTYPVVYLQLMGETGRSSFTANELFNRMKPQIGRVLWFSLLAFLILFPLLIVATAISIVAIFLVVGIFLIIMLMPIYMVWTMQSFFVYMNEGKGFFKSLAGGWNILFCKRFWHIIGATFVVYIVIYIIQMIFSMIPYSFMMVSLLNTGETGNFDSSGIQFLLIAIYIISMVTSYLFTNFLMITQGLIYYSSVEQEQHTQVFSEIDTIGQHAE